MERSITCIGETGLGTEAGYNSRLQLPETYEAIDNSVGKVLSFSCLNWSPNPDYGQWLCGFCPVSKLL